MIERFPDVTLIVFHDILGDDCVALRREGNKWVRTITPLQRIERGVREPYHKVIRRVRKREFLDGESWGLDEIEAAMSEAEKHEGKWDRPEPKARRNSRRLEVVT
jgi:hypothetical protein